MKARLKFLIKDWGYDKLVEEINKEWQVLDKSKPIEHKEEEVVVPQFHQTLNGSYTNQDEYKLWQQKNVLAQKNGLFAIGLKIRLGDILTSHARKLALWASEFSGDEFTLTINQNLIVRHIDKKALPIWHERLKSIGLADIGFNKFSDITACPGTDTCNLGIASSTGLSLVLENVLKEEYPEFSNNKDLSIKLSGCMNACGQHMVSSIGFQGMSMKAKDKRVLPAAQILIGGGRVGDGKGRFGDKLIKVPSKKAPDALRRILHDYKSSEIEEEDFLSYYDRKGEKYFYDLLKDLGSIDSIEEEDFIDWGHSAPYIKAIGVGECAGVVIDLISTLFFESEEKIESAKRSLEEGKIRDGIYHSYSAIVNTAKALLLAEDQKTNTHAGIISNFNDYFIKTHKITVGGSFEDFVLRLRKEEASLEFAKNYYDDSVRFYLLADKFRKNTLEL
jgi:sulfite reductase (ferredoxin)